MSEAHLPGLIGVFESPEALRQAARELRDAGLCALDAYTPYEIEGLDEMLRPRTRLRLPLVILAGAVVGACAGMFVQYWDEAIDYPINVGGRPHDSWPAFVVGGFETTVLFAVAAGFFALLLACRLPRLYQPIFAAQGFERASQDRFMLRVAAADPAFEERRVRAVLRRHGAERVVELPAEAAP
ncbi:MAG TPA: DUF3341 domain-containing protein [Stellaceae bacterium]|nr:DUF3341 domain-containing protein [Stellaceae bacterium]